MRFYVPKLKRGPYLPPNGVYHLANKCPKKKKAKVQEQGKKQPDMGLFIETNVKNSAEAVCATTVEEKTNTRGRI